MVIVVSTTKLRVSVRGPRCFGDFFMKVNGRGHRGHRSDEALFRQRRFGPNRARRALNTDETERFRAGSHEQTTC